jgi:acyl dehydratase
MHRPVGEDWVTASLTREGFSERAGSELGVSDWFAIGQDRIGAFAEVTEDRQYIHLDPVRAAQTAFGGTVAHGFLTLAMLSAMSYSALPEVQGASASVNYGFDAIRFIAPVRSGASIRGRFVLDSVEERADGSLMAILAVTVEVQSEKRPAMSARWRILFLF